MIAARPLETRPTCVVCQKPVEHFYEVHDGDWARVKFIACCHGARETVTLPEGEARGLSFGLAFVPQTSLLEP